MGLKKSRLGFIKVFAGAGLAVEFALFCGSYYVWHRMNTSQDFRFYMHKNYPEVLNGYYTVGEKLSGYNEIRALDLEEWEKKETRK